MLALYTAPVPPEHRADHIARLHHVAVTFEVTAPTSTGETISVVGDQAALGSWNTGAAVAMTQSGSVWRATVNLPQGTAIQYKYIRKTSAGAVTWEYDPNRAGPRPTACAVTWTETWNGPGLVLAPWR
jgi:alpha-amylase